MIFGIGTDLIEVDRVAEKMENKAGFKELVFSADEIIYCEARTINMNIMQPALQPRKHF